MDLSHNQIDELNDELFATMFELVILNLSNNSLTHFSRNIFTSKLVLELELKRKFNQCIHRTDWTVGQFIPDQIFRSVDES
ncbi:hypothetical protein DMENIID0001_156720 [Sergentomyia squamirostris]